MKTIISTLLLTACAFNVQAQRMSATTTQTVEQCEWNVALVLYTQHNDYAAFQMDITVDDAITIESIETGASLVNHTLQTVKRQTDDHTTVVRLLAYSLSGAKLSFGSTPFITLNLTSASGKPLAEGDYTFSMTNIRFAHLDGSEDIITDRTLSVTSSKTIVPDAVQMVLTDARADIYTITGHLVKRNARLSDVPSGMYIIRGKKVVKP